MRLSQVKEEFALKKNRLRCHEVIRLLASLGFEVRSGSSGGHKIFTHSGIRDFHSASFNCGHGKNPEIKPAYITNILKVITRYEDALRTYLEENSYE